MLAVKPQQMREAAASLAPHLADRGRRRRSCCRSPPGIRADRRPRALAAAAIDRHRARDAEHAGADRAGASPGVFARRGVTPRAARAPRRARGGRRACSGSRREDDARRGHRRLRQRPGVRVLFPRSARGRRRGSWASRRRTRAGSPTRRSPAPSRWREAVRPSPATLRAQVTSKGGTTERALATLEAAAVKATIVAAVKAAAARAARARRRLRPRRLPMFDQAAPVPARHRSSGSSPTRSCCAS